MMRLGFLSVMLALALLACVPVNARSARSSAYADMTLSDLRALAESGESNAQFALAIRYGQGKDVERDDKTALMWLEKSANQGNSQAEYGLGLFKLAGKPADPPAALQWFQRALAHGNHEALGMLGRMYRLGEGVERDYAKAAVYIKQASEEGSFADQYALGELYEKGNGVSQDKVTALKWYILAARVDPGDCQSAVDNLEKEMSADDIALATAQADAFVPVTTR